MLFSIVMPVYNVELYLEECLDSLVLQDFSDYEIILVDDGSPDNCPAICDRYAAKYPNITVIHQKNQGLSCARNAGMAKAQGKYLCFIDTDDSVSQDYFAELAKAVEDDPDIVIFGYREKRYNGTKDVIFRQDSVEKICYNYMTDTWSCFAWNKCFKWDLYPDLHFIPGKIFEDIYTIPYLFLRAQTIKCIEKPLYNYNLKNWGSLSRRLNAGSVYDLWGGWHKLGTDAYAVKHYNKELQFKIFSTAQKAYFYNLFDARLNKEQVDKLKLYLQEVLADDKIAVASYGLVDKFLAMQIINDHKLVPSLICWAYGLLKKLKDTCKYHILGIILVISKVSSKSK